MGTLLAAFAIAITLYCPFSVTIALKHGYPYLKFKADHILESFFFHIIYLSTVVRINTSWHVFTG